MSSHYIIREDQEPGLLILDPLVVDSAVIPSLLEWGPTVMITQQAVPYIFQHNFKIDALYIYDLLPDHVNTMLEYQKPYDLYLSESNSVIHDTKEYLDKRGISGLNIVGEITPLLKEAIYSDLQDITTTVYFKNAKYYYVSDGNFSKWSTPGHGFFIEPEVKVKTKGLKNLDQSHYKAEREGKIWIEADQAFWLGEIIL